MLVWDAAAGKVNFEFAPSKFPPRKTAPQAAQKTAPKATAAGKMAGTKSPAKAKPPAKKAAAKSVANKAAGASAAGRTARKTAAGTGMLPSAALAAVIGNEPVARTQVIKKLWDYIKENQLQDAVNKRAINADAKLELVFGKPQITMFELAGIVGKHLIAQ
jgi:DNA topoisomerase-3